MTGAILTDAITQLIIRHTGQIFPSLHSCPDTMKWIRTEAGQDEFLVMLHGPRLARCVIHINSNAEERILMRSIMHGDLFYCACFADLQYYFWFGKVFPLWARRGFLPSIEG